MGFLLLHQQLCKLLPDRDPYILPIVALLSGWGLLTIYRLNSDFGIRQTLWLGLCLLLLWVAARIPGLLNLLRRYKYLWLLAGLLLTAMTLVMGFFRPSGSPQLWLGIRRQLSTAFRAAQTAADHLFGSLFCRPDANPPHFIIVACTYTDPFC